MARVKDPNSDERVSTVKVGGWPAGMNNIQPAYALPEGALRDAANVDITDSGKLKRRKGFARTYTGVGVHSFWSEGGYNLFAEGNSLKQLNANMSSASTLVSTLTQSVPVSYVLLNDEVYWSNGIVTGKLTRAGANMLWGIPVPAKPVGTPITSGGMDAGIYQVAFTFVLASGEEGGSDQSIAVTVPAGGGILLTGLKPPAVAEIASLRVYVTAPNGETEYFYKDVPASTTSLAIAKSASPGHNLKTQGDYPFPPCDMLEYFRGHLFGAKDNVIWHSNPMRYRLCRMAENYIQLATDVTLLKAVPDGIFVSDAQTTYFFVEDNSMLDVTALKVTKGKHFNLLPILPYPAIPGTAVKIANSTDIAWFSTRGWVIGSAGGKVQNLTEKHIMPAVYSSGACGFREQDGVRQLVSSLTKQTQTNNLVATDYANATIIRTMSKKYESVSANGLLVSDSTNATVN